MLFAVIETHRQGVRLSREEIRAAEPIVGQLEITDWPHGNAFRRAVRVANLRHPAIDYYPALLTPLFDPVIVRMTSQGFLLVGVQIHATDTGTFETTQGWWVRAPHRDMSQS